MKHTIFFIIIFSFLFISNNSFAQGEAAVPFLLLQPSPSLSAMGQTGTALPSEDPFAFIWNPAQLGHSSRNNNFSFIFYPSKLDWLPAFNLDLEVKSLAFNLGYNLKEIIDFPLSVGFGYSNVELNFGEFLRTGETDPTPIGSFYSKDYYNAYSLGFGIDYYCQFNVGFTYKKITSILSDRPTSQEMGEGKAEPSVVDFGLLINVPISNLIDTDMQFNLDDGVKIKPDFNFSLGYSKSNIGDEVYYIDPEWADPPPRLDRFGYGINAKLNLITDDFQINALDLSFTGEVDDILIKSKHYSTDSLTIYGWDYQSTFSDLKPFKNLFTATGDDNIVTHIGYRLELFETISFMGGHFDGRGFDMRKTNGYELRTKGLFKLWALWAKDPITDFLRDHIDVRYYHTNFIADNFLESKMTGLAIYIHNFNSIF